MSVISILLDDIISSRRPDSKFIIYVPDKSRAITDPVSAIEFIRETFGIPVSKFRRQNEEVFTMHALGSQMLEMYLGYDTELSARPDTRDPYSKQSLDEFLRKRNIVPIFDVSRTFGRKDVSGTAAFREKYSGYLRNLRDAYVHRKVLSEFDNYKQSVENYRRALATFETGPTKTVSFPIINKYRFDKSHVFLMDENNELFLRRKIFDPGYLVRPDDSLTTNVIGTESEIRTVDAGRREMIFEYPKYGFRGVAVPSAEPKQKTYVIPRDTEKFISDVRSKSVGIALFKYPAETFNADASVRDILSRGIDTVPYDTKCWADYVRHRPESLLLGNDSDVLRKSVSDRIAENAKRIEKRKAPKLPEPGSLILDKTDTGLFDMPFDDLVREVFYWEGTQKNSTRREIALARIKELAARQINGKYYSRVTGNEFEFLAEEEDDLTGIDFDTELRMLQSTFSESDYVSLGTIFDDRINDIMTITGSWHDLDNASETVFKHDVSFAPKVPKISAIYNFTKSKYPKELALRKTNGQPFSIPGKKSDPMSSKIKTAIKTDIPSEDMTSVSDVLRKYEIDNKIDWHSLASDNPELRNVRGIKDSINRILKKYASVTETDLDRQLISQSGVSDVSMSVAVFKIGLFEQRYATMSKTQAVSEELRETFKFATALRQEIAVAQFHDFVPVDSPEIETLSEMHKRTMIARNNSQLKSLGLNDILERLGVKAIPSIYRLSDAFPSNIFVSDPDYEKIMRTGTGIALTMVLEILENIYKAITDKKTGMRERGQKIVLSLVESVFINVIAEEMALRVFTDVDGRSVRWVFQELFTQNRFRSIMVDDYDVADDDNVFSNAGVNFWELASEDMDMEEVMEIVSGMDDMARDISMMTSEWDDLE